MTTAATITLTKLADGSYEFDSYTIRKQTQEDVYDPWAEKRGHVTRYLPAAPKPSGWVVRHPLHELGWARTLDDAKDLIRRHKSGPWNSRCELFAEEIDRPDADQDAVLNAVTRFGLTVADFWELDERPGHFYINGHSYSQAGSFWHRNLRVTRNTRRELFDRLAR